MSGDIRSFCTKPSSSQTQVDDTSALYSSTKNSVATMLKSGSCIDGDVLRNMLNIIKSDSNSKDQNLRKASQEMLEFLLSAGIVSTEFDVQLLELVCDGKLSKDLSDLVVNTFTEKVQKSLLENSNSFKIVEIVKKISERRIIDEALNLIEEITSEKLPIEATKRFLLDHIMPVMFQPDTLESTRDQLTAMAIRFLARIPRDCIQPEEMKAQIMIVSEKYIPFVVQLRETQYAKWHQLWIFLVRFCGKHIHSSMELANKLLRVVEYAFRNTSYQQRLIGYDCWKEFIDNASLDLDHMCSHKQIKLLVTPLKAKFSKLEVVICKRYEVFVHLLEKLQHRAVLCLNEFLEFCFGPLSSNVEVNKCGQGKAVSQLWGKSTNVLMEILGHSHKSDEVCLEEKLICLKAPVLNSENISMFVEVTIKASSECFILLKSWCSDVNLQQTIIKCLWGSFLKHVLDSKEAKRKQCNKVLIQYLDSMANKFDDEHIRSIFIGIIDSTLSYDKVLISELFTPVLIDGTIKILFTCELADQVADKVASYVCLCLSSKHKDIYVTSFLKCINDVEQAENTESVCKIWLMIDDVEDFRNQNATVEKIISFLMWPVCHYHLFTEELKQAVLSNWAKIFIYMCNDSEDNKCLFLLHLEKFFKTNPLRSGTIISFVAIISQFERNHIPDFVMKFFKLCSMVLTLPTLPKDDLLKLCSVLLGFMDLSLPFYDKEDNDVVIKAMCTSFEYVLKIHKHYEFLASLSSCIKSMPNKLKVKFLTPLFGILEKLTCNEDSKVVADSTALLAIIMSDKEKKNKTSPSSVFQIPNSRASKIVNKLKDNEKNTKIVQQRELLNASPSPKAPAKIKGSMLSNNNTPSPKRARKIMNALPKKEIRTLILPENDDTSDYVPIDTVVKFEPSKLSEHQREVLKKRREDIPALYQDLSQSQSQDMFRVLTSNSNSNSNSAQEKVESVPVKLEETVEREDENVEITNSAITPSNIVPGDQRKSLDNQTDDSKEIITMNNDAQIEIIEESDTEHPKDESNSVTITFKDHLKNIIEENKNNQGYSSDTSVASTDSGKEMKKKKLSKIEVELNRIRMDLVGGDQFVKNIGGKRRTRSTIENEKLQLRPRGSDSPNEKKKSKAIARVTKTPQRALSPKITSKAKKETSKQSAVSEIAPTDSQINTETQIVEIISQTQIENKIVETQEKEEDKSIVAQTEKQEDTEVVKTPSPKPTSTAKRIMSPKSTRKSLSPKSPVKKDTASMDINEHFQNAEPSVYDFRENQEDELIEHSYATFERNQLKDKVKKKKAPEESQQFSEDIIESSQESFVNLNPVLSPRKRKLTKEKSFESSEMPKKLARQKSFEQDDKPISSSDSSKKNKENKSNIGVAQTQIQTMHTQTQNDSHTETDTCESRNVSPTPIVLTIDRPRRPILTDSEKELCQADTESLSSDIISPNTINRIIGGNKKVTPPKNIQNTENTIIESVEMALIPSRPTDLPLNNASNDKSPDPDDTKIKSFEFKTPERPQRMDSLPTSPVTGDTPNKTTEFLNDTMNISPISSEPNSPPEEKQGSNHTMQVDEDQSCCGQNPSEIRMEVESNSEIEMEVVSTSESGMEVDASSEKITKLSKSNGTAQPAVRAARLLNLINIDSPVTHRVNQKRRPLRITMSPATGRIRKLMSGFQSMKNDEEAEPEKQEAEEDVLTFSREIPSPFAVPRSSILKRKLPDDIEEGASPCPKRKRVNFSDPTTTSRKVFIKHKDELPTSSPEKLILTATALFKDIEVDEEDENIDSNSEAKENISNNSPQSQQNINGINEAEEKSDPVSCINQNSDDQKSKSPENVNTSLTEGSEVTSLSTPDTLDVTNPLLLRDNRPIYPDLINCDEDLLPVLKKVTSPMFVTSLLQDLNKKNVKTIGDLAKLSEAEVNRLPFKAPAINNVFKTLDSYYKKKMTGEKTEEKSDMAEPTDGADSAKVNTVRKSPNKRSPSRSTAKKVVVPLNGLERNMKLDEMLGWTDVSNKEQQPRKNVPDSISQQTNLGSEIEQIISSDRDDRNEDMIDDTEEITSTSQTNSTNDKSTKSNTTDTSNKRNPKKTSQTKPRKQPSVEEPSENTSCGEVDANTNVSLPARIDQPIYSNLIDCDDPLLPILKKITSPKYVTSLLEVLSEKDVKTVGDLAKMTEMQITRLPFKEPRVENVFKNLDAHHKRKDTEKNAEGTSGKKKNDNSDIEPASKKTSTRQASPKPSSSTQSPPLSPLGEPNRRIIMLPDVMSWTDDCSKEDAIIILNQLIGHHRDTMLPIVRCFYKSNIDEVLVNSDMKMVLEHVVKKVGLSEAIRIISKLAESTEDQSVHFDGIIKNCIEKKPVDALIGEKSVDDIAKGLQTLVEKEKFSKTEIMEKCLVPFVKFPEDIASCFNQLTVLEIGDVLIERMTATHANFFVEHISTKFGNEFIYNMVNKHEILEMCSTEDVLPVVTRSNTKEMVDFFEKAVNSIEDSDKQNEVLINMFKTISSKLSVKTLTTLHVEFIQSISNKITEL